MFIRRQLSQSDKLVPRLKISTISYLILQFIWKFKKIHDYDKTYQIVYNAKVSYLWTGIMKDKSEFSQTSVVFKKKD